MKEEVKEQLINYLLNFYYLLINEKEIKNILDDHKELANIDNENFKKQLCAIVYNYLNGCSFTSLLSFYANIFGLKGNEFYGILYQSVNEVSGKNLTLQDEEFYEILMTENILYPTTFYYEFFSFEETDFMLIKKLYELNSNISNKYNEILAARKEIIEYEELIALARNSSEKSSYEEEKADAKRRKDKLEAEILNLDENIASLAIEISERRKGTVGIGRVRKED